MIWRRVASLIQSFIGVGIVEHTMPSNDCKSSLLSELLFNIVLHRIGVHLVARHITLRSFTNTVISLDWIGPSFTMEQRALAEADKNQVGPQFFFHSDRSRIHLTESLSDKFGIKK